MFSRSSVLVTSLFSFSFALAACSGAPRDMAGDRQEDLVVDCNGSPAASNGGCGVGFHCEPKGINGRAVPACIRDEGDVCEGTLGECAAGYHCEPKGINGGVVPVCIQDALDGGPAPDSGDIDGGPAPDGGDIDGGPGPDSGDIDGGSADAEAECPATHPAYGAPCAAEGTSCRYEVDRCGSPSFDDVQCRGGTWFWYALGACPAN